jgi:hypothetical protein
VAPLLAGLAAGTLDLTEPASRQQIAVAVTRLRRYLVENDDVPDPLSHELRACADAAERHGVAVDLIAPAGVIPMLPVTVRRALVEPVIQVLAGTVSRARITVIASQAEVAVAIVSDTSLARVNLTGGKVTGSDYLLRCDWDKEGDTLWAQVKWMRSSVSLSSTTTKLLSRGNGPGSRPTCGGGRWSWGRARRSRRHSRETGQRRTWWFSTLSWRSRSSAARW